MLEEGIITIGTVSGIFTALLLNSLKNNIIDPLVEKTIPLNKLQDLLDDGKLNNSVPNSSSSEEDKEKKYNLPDPFMFGNQFGGFGKDKIKWKIFLRDFITWIVIIFILYLIWKHILNPIKMKNSLSVPSTNTQFIPMGMGGKKGKV